MYPSRPAVAAVVLALVCVTLAGCAIGGNRGALATATAGAAASDASAAATVATRLALASQPTASPTALPSDTPAPTASPTETRVATEAAPTATTTEPATEAADPTATPAPAVASSGHEAARLTERELAVLLDAVAEALTDCESVTLSVDTAAADGTVSRQEVDDIETLLLICAETLATTDAYVEQYYGLYSDLAPETVAAITQIVADLDALTADIDEIAKLLVNGAEAATANLAQLQQASARARANMATAQEARNR